jgi:hypothetical protein
LKAQEQFELQAVTDMTQSDISHIGGLPEYLAAVLGGADGGFAGADALSGR